MLELQSHFEENTHHGLCKALLTMKFDTRVFAKIQNYHLKFLEEEVIEL